jgi:uncharacterized protein DUF4337
MPGVISEHARPAEIHLEPGTRASKLGGMEEAEVPLEHLQEETHHHTEHGGEKWISWVALSTAILPVLAAISALLSGSHANEAMMRQIESADQWAFYQAKGIKAAVLDAKMSLIGSSSEADPKRRHYWMVSMLIGAVGCIFLMLGFVQD